MNYHNELFHSLLNSFLTGESALMSFDGEILGLRGEHPVSFGTLTTAGSTAAKYLHLQEGDIALMNDPYSGGSLLHEMTFVMAISEDLLWVTRRSLTPSLKLTKSVEEEGLRIPPTPLRQKNQLNEMILQAMQMHPACPPDFIPWIKEQIVDLTNKAKKLHEAIEFTGFTITGELIEEYIAACKNIATQKISERASGETKVDVVLDSGELLRLNLEIHDGKVHMDFGGTSSTKTVALTEAATYGTCLYALSKFYGFQDLSNSGTFSVLQVTKPSGCWLMAKYPVSTYKGMTCGVAALQTAIDLALAQIHTKQEHSIASHCALQFSLEYKDQKQVLDLSGGKAANSENDGSCARISACSVEELEQKFPVKVLRIDRRHSTGGKGKKNGGRGLILKLAMQEDVQASWLTDLTLHRPRLPKNCSHGDPCEISLEQQGETHPLPVLGHQVLKKQEIVVLSSGSGGGVGRVE